MAILPPHACAGLAADIAGHIRPLGLYDDYNKSAEYFYIMPKAIVMRASIALGRSYFSLQAQQNPLLPVFEGLKLVVEKAYADGNMVCSLKSY